ncbi:MAG TPA: GAF domain-containing SpoIIE family protein phosphatase, partial [Candidatus Binatia bacterium]|nr:GAF domain-containing SpoIIE family protein phosphatase [Candidatus Binatia bacterium]
DPEKEELTFETATGENEKALKQIVLKKGQGVAGLIAAEKKGVIINDCPNDPRHTAMVDRKTLFQTRSLLGVPVLLEDRVLGVLEAVNKKKGKFSQDDLRVLEQMAGFLAIPLHNAVLFRAIRRETLAKERLIELGKRISASTDISGVLAALKEIICAEIQPLAASVHVSEEKKEYDLLASSSREQDAPECLGTTIGRVNSRFPLRSEGSVLGFLDIQSEKMISAETAALFRGLAAFMAISLEKFRLYRQMLEKEKMEKELQVARDIQQSFLLQGPQEFPGLDIAFLNIPSSKVGGDYYEIIAPNDREIIFSINDVSGHGVPASLLMAIFRSNFVFQLQHGGDIAAAIGYLNRLIAETTEANLFVTSFSAKLEPGTGTLTYINAGHPSPLVVRGRELLALEGGGTVVGMFAAVEHPVSSFAMRPGDILLLFTDGVIEAENESNEEYSLARLGAVALAHRELPAAAIQAALIEDLRNHCLQQDFADDVTLMVVKYLGN